MRPLRARLRSLSKLISCRSGNAAVLLAIGMPMLIGSAGLAVDVAQWYMWKNELQYAADQGAIAGAWSQTSSISEANYVSRARQEFTANLSTVKTFAEATSVTLADYDGGTLNSVVVRARATKSLPFTSILTGRGITIRVVAQASFGQRFTPCLLALDPTASGALRFDGNPTLTADCGMGSLSTSASSVIVNGNPTADAGWVVSAGGIDDWLNLPTDGKVHEYLNNLSDPFARLTPPTNTTPQTYSCAGGIASAIATTTTTISTAYAYFIGPSQGNALPTTYALAKTGTTASPTVLDLQSVPSGHLQSEPSETLEGSTSTSVVNTWTQVTGSGTVKIFEQMTTTTFTVYSNVIESDTGQASNLPGTYPSMRIKCTTVLSPGIYVIDGGGLEIDGRYTVAGSGVMFVLKNGAYIKITGGSNVSLTAPTSTQLISAGVSSAQAALLSGMLVFEDRSSRGSNKTRISGNASTVLNGTLYFPVSTVNFAGSATATSQCLMIAANKIVIEGTADMSSFCPDGQSNTAYISSTVRLVS